MNYSKSKTKHQFRAKVYLIVCRALKRKRTGIEQRCSRGHKARSQGQGHKKSPRPRPRTAFPRTDILEAKAKDQEHKRKRSPKKKGFQNFFSGDLQFIGVPRIFDWGSPKLQIT